MVPMVRLNGQKVTFCTCLSEATFAFGNMCCPSSLERKPKEKLPPTEEYLAYIFCPGTTIFGVWVSFTDFQKSIRNLKRNEISHGKMYRAIGLALLWSLLWALLGFHSALYFQVHYNCKICESKNESILSTDLKF